MNVGKLVSWCRYFCRSLAIKGYKHLFNYTIYSQYGQDFVALKYLNREIKKLSGGGYTPFYIDIGANDGVSFSNSKMMEELGWDGICIEPDSDVYRDLIQNRTCCCINVAVSNTSGMAKFTKITGPQMLSGLSDGYSDEHKERIRREVEACNGKIEEVTVPLLTFEEIMKKIPKRKRIDFVSIDTEGNEDKILRSINLDKWDIRLFAVENNYKDCDMRRYMKQWGYKFKRLGADDLYIKCR